MKRVLVFLALLGAAGASLRAQTLPIVYLQEFDSPIVLNDAQLRASGHDPTSDVVLEVANESNKTVGLLEFVLAPAECAGVPGGLHIKFQARQSPLRPESQLEVVIRGSLISRVLHSQSEAGCPDDSMPELSLSTVGFCDGTGWYGDGSGYSEWRGRPWIHWYSSACGSEK